jgi:hypothetical protein
MREEIVPSVDLRFLEAQHHIEFLRIGVAGQQIGCHYGWVDEIVCEAPFRSLQIALA